MTIARIAVLGFALASIAPAVAAQTAPAPPSREVITRDRIESTGIHRFSDLVAWIGTTTGTVEGLSWVFSVDELPTGLSTFGSLPGPTILVDGLPVDVEAHQGQFPELLPLSLQQIDSVVVIRRPGVVAGRVQERGVIHFHTSAPGRGAALRVWGRHGAETGDPGPYQYTPESTPNIQRSGPDGALSVAYGRGRWDLEVTARYVETAVDDSVARAIQGPGPSYTAYARGGTVRAGVQIAGRRQQLLFSRHNQLGDTWIPTRGRIAHSRITKSHLGIAGDLPIGDATLAYRIASSTGAASFSTSSENEYARASLDASAEVLIPLRAMRVGLGAGLERLSLDPVWTDDAPVSTSIPRVVASVRTERGPGSLGLAAEGRLVDGRISPSVLTSFTTVAGEGTLGATLSYSSHRADEPQGREYALSFPDSARLDSELWRASAGWARTSARFGAVIELDAGGGIWRIRSSEPSVAVKEGQRFVSVGAGVRSSSTGAVQGGVRYRGILWRSGADDAPAITTLAPSHELSGHISYQPVESFRLGASTLLKKPAVWAAADYGIPAAFEPESLHRVDLSAEKWLWSGRLRTQLVVANVLGESERYHPAGGDFALRYFVTGELVVK